MFWSKNRQALLIGHPHHQPLVNTLDEVAATSQAQFCDTEAADFTLLYQGIYLHDPKGAIAEARTTVQNSCKPGLGRAHLILGLGLGYVVEAVYQHSPGHVVVYEPDLQLLKFLLENVDLSEYLGSGRVCITSSIPDAITQLKPHITGEDPLDVIAIAGCAEHLNADIQLLMTQLFQMVEERIRDIKTGKHFHLQWTKQFFQNLPHFTKTTSFAEVSEPFQGKPALIIGRGPSLDHALEAIQSVSNAMTLIATGSALHRLYQADITPDIAIFYDANGVQEQLHGLPEDYLSRIIFFISPFTQTQCFTAPSQAKVLFYPQNGEPFANWLKATSSGNSAWGETLVLEGGGTVSLLAMQLAMALQSSHIVLIGQDLAFPHNQVYAGGIALKQDEQGRLALEKTDTLFTAPEAMTEVAGQNQQPLPALKAYTGFIRHFERLAASNAQSTQPIELYNASLGGAHIEGFTLKALSKFKGRFKPFKPVDAISFDGQSEHNNTQEALRGTLSHLRSSLDKGIQLHALSLEKPDDGEVGHALYEFLNQNPLIAHFLMFEMMETQSRYNPKPLIAQAVADNQALLKQNARNCLEILRQQILPLALTAERQLLEAASNQPGAVTIEHA